VALEFFAPAIFLDHHVGNLVDAFVGGEAALALQAFAPPPDQVAAAALARVHYLVI
jgi:hypothetical protein